MDQDADEQIYIEREADQLPRTAYYEAGHMVAAVGILRHVCFEVSACRYPKASEDSNGQLRDQFGNAANSIDTLPPNEIATRVWEDARSAEQLWVHAVNCVLMLAAGPFCEAEFIGEGDTFGEINRGFAPLLSR